jgi:hypothetical protein
MNLTAKRRAWLQRLLLGPAHRPRGRNGYVCMQEGLTEWNYVDRHGQPISFEEAKARWGIEHVFEHIRGDGERLTAKGRKLLEDDAMSIDGHRMLGIDRAIDLVRIEAMQAIEKWPPFHSSHEGYGVLLEEVDELWDEVKANNKTKAKAEAVQVAAMALRFIAELGD